MKIDGNELAIRQMELEREGKRKESFEMKMEFLRQVREAGDHCNCPESCPHHGNCFECVTIHRGHRDHLPYCMWDMLNERLHGRSLLTEGTLSAYGKDKETANAGCPGGCCE
ncbi:LPS biosynthesis protein [Anaerotalea alkaliphila]|uniref:LPS biosynthesis protein n=1 Tax=Anaerotalea alkaliphila TaxID=2662126 RepID=A0A7X5HUL6_9FIRM|nr:LPS biosynthesis protein [Anaerotalea alkaliphila]NDL66980.1 LPS biosynthesis protein [Anaerotalea alkaliphila]